MPVQAAGRDAGKIEWPVNSSRSSRLLRLCVAEMFRPGELIRHEAQFVRRVGQQGCGDAYTGEPLGQGQHRRFPVDVRGAVVVLPLKGQGKAHVPQQRDQVVGRGALAPPGALERRPQFTVLEPVEEFDGLMPDASDNDARRETCPARDVPGAGRARRGTRGAAGPEAGPAAPCAQWSATAPPTKPPPSPPPRPPADARRSPRVTPPVPSPPRRRASPCDSARQPGC